MFGGLWEYKGGGNLLKDYVSETYSYEERINTSVTGSKSLGSSGSFSGTISSSSGITNSSKYKYALNFRVKSSSAIDITANVGSYKRNIFLSRGGELYVTVPCNYISSGSFSIKNNGSGTVTISNISYSVMNYFKVTKTFEDCIYNAYRIS